jgi:hypothetical protein
MIRLACDVLDHAGSRETRETNAKGIGEINAKGID